MISLAAGIAHGASRSIAPRVVYHHQQPRSWVIDRQLPRNCRSWLRDGGRHECLWLCHVAADRITSTLTAVALLARTTVFHPRHHLTGDAGSSSWIPRRDPAGSEPRHRRSAGPRVELRRPASVVGEHPVQLSNFRLGVSVKYYL